ncbi:NUDIX domain-containing protein [Bacillus sp. DX1.1]|uniref:NUDIX hydrolase n=1 Tax=unclassified Bacillus (in: firmicutes) TaxID=185979 RepID=UPI00256FEB58|nr:MULTISPECIES: NUDIX domain-containing protein [unclassified Bacillus (in: firmicutes)]MDM5155342.1 NUDIX domain-containing protein [Bacillus sp. DX1.1]WJE79659.1 NUDIX domain-containing protein [Bacillus sp. DX3.1]
MRTNIRTSGVLIHNEHVLLHKMDDFWILPGGAVEFNGVDFETTMEALKREYKEELDVEINIIKLLWIAENFFEYENKKEQGIEFYYLIEVLTDTSIYEQRSFEGYEHESNSVLKFRWFKIEEIDSITILPMFLNEYLKKLKEMPKEIEHIISKKV